MKKKFLATIVATGAILSGCSGEKAAKSSDGGGSTMTGVAAVGAPIANGFVEVKGANGTIVTATTNTSGVYNVGLGALASPYLVRVTSPTGQRYFTVASKEDVSASKKINITPITHTIVANVFKEKSPDTLFDTFTNKSNVYSQSAVNLAKDDFRQKMIDAGVIGGNGILTDTNVDLMNGSFEAGSGTGVDKLLDALEIDVEKGVSNIEVNLKGGLKIYSNNIANFTLSEAAIDHSGSIDTLNKQLNALSEIKKSLSDVNKIFKAVAVCSGPAVDVGSCNKADLNNRVKSIFHTNYLSSGFGMDEESWSIICSKDKVDGEIEASDSSECLYINSVIPSFSDVVILDLNADKTEADIQFNFYQNGVFRIADTDKLALEVDAFDMNSNGNTLEKVWKFKGNQNKHLYSFQPTSVHKTIYTSGVASQRYEAQIQMNIFEMNAILGTSVTLRAVKKDGSNNSELNTQLRGNAISGLGLTAGLDNNPRNLTVTAKNYIDYLNNTTLAENTNCPTCILNYDANKIELSETALLHMDAVQKFELKYNDADGVRSDIIYINRPLKVTANNAASLVPNFSSHDLCGTVKESYSITKPDKHTFGFGSIYLSTPQQGQALGYVSLSGSELLEGKESISVSIDDTNLNIEDYIDEALNFATFYISSEDSLGRMSSRYIECK